MSILNVKQVETGFVLGSIRSILWMLAKGCLLLLDGMFSVINEVWQFKFFDNEYVNTIFGGAIIFAGTWIILKVMLEFLINHILKNDNNQNPLTIFKGIALAITVMFLITPIFNWGFQFSTSLTNSVIEVTNSSSGIENSISSAVIESMANNDSMRQEDKIEFIANWRTIDYNEKDKSGLFTKDTYKYDFNLFMLIIVSILILFLLLFIGIQMAKRVVELALYRIIGPVVATSLTNPKSKAFQTWSKGAIALFLVTSIQFICLGLLINVFGSTIDQSSNIMTSLLLLIGGLLFVITSPNVVSSLLGENIGAMGAFNDIQTTVMMGAGAGMGLNVAKTGVMGALAKGSSVMNIVPKSAGLVKGMGDQYKNVRASGESKLSSLAKVGINQIGSPFKSKFDNQFNKFKDIYSHSRSSTLSRNISKNINPIAFVERKGENNDLSYTKKY